MMQAALGGLIDFREAERDSPSWWRRLRMLLAALNRDNTRKIKQLRLQFLLSQMGAESLAEGEFDRIQKLAIEQLDGIERTYRPWMAEAVEDDQAKFSDAASQWEKAFGMDPTSPEFLKMEAEALARLAEEERRNSGGPEMMDADIAAARVRQQMERHGRQ